MAKLTIPSNETINGTGLSAKRSAGRTLRTILTGGRAAPLAREAGTYERTLVSEARRTAMRTLDATIGRPTGRGVTDADRLAWLLDGEDDGEV